MPFVALQGRPLQSATIGYAITPNPVRPFFNAFAQKSRFFLMAYHFYAYLYTGFKKRPSLFF